MRRIVLLVWLGLAFGAAAAPDLRNGVAAIVNDSIITYQDVEDYTLEAIDLLRRTYARTQPEVFRQKRIETMMDGLERLIERQLILNDFKTLGAQLPESVIDQEVNDRIRRLFRDRATLTKSLQKQATTTEAYRQRLRDDIVVNIMRQRNVSP